MKFREYVELWIEIIKNNPEAGEYDILYDLDGRFEPNDLVQKIIELNESHKWQPIETAPKDGTSFLVPGHKLAYYDPDSGRWTKAYTSLLIYPTHWMPLPKPPKNYKEQINGSI